MNADGTQYGEGQLILDHFGDRKGHFLDIGAFNGVTLSNTLPLAARGWTGVLVEPDPVAFAELMRDYPYPDQVEMVNAAVASTARVAEFFVNTPNCLQSAMLSTLDAAHAGRCADQPFRRVHVATTTWGGLLSAFKERTFDFVNIDTESTNFKVLAMMPSYPEMLCVEIEDGENTEQNMRRMLTYCNYTHFQRVGGNLLAWRDA